MRQILWDDWKVSDKIGEGRFADVYKAVHDVNGVVSTCAIKYVSLPRYPNETDILVSKGIIKNYQDASRYYLGIVNGLKKEIEIMQKFNDSPYIVGCFDFLQEVKSDRSGFDFYIRMELVEDIEKYFSNKKAEVSDVVQMGIDICSALELCSSMGIVHKDIKPSNIFVGDDNHYKLGDFGIAASLDTANQKVVGTYNYMAPEVYHKKNVNQSTDLYSLALVMYKFLNSDKLPFVNKSISEEVALKNRMSGMEIPPIWGVDRKLMDIILKACSYDSKNRYANASEMKQELEKIRGINFKKRNLSITSDSADKTVSIYDTELSIDSKTAVADAKNKLRNIGNKIHDRESIQSEINFDTLKPILVGIALLIVIFLFIKGCFWGKKCDEGYINKNGTCVKGYYYCDEGYTLNKDNKCQKTLESIEARANYSCDKDYILKDKVCYRNDIKDPIQKYQCADGFELQGTKCVREESADALVTYSCPNNYVLTGTECVTISNVSPSTSYTCPDSSYKLSGKTCTKTESNSSWLTSSSSCPAGGSLQNGQCYASASCSYYQYWGYCYGGYTCPNGYSLSGTSCYASPNVSKSCSQGTYSNGTCVKNTTTEATVKYTCPSGYSSIGNQCAKTSGIKATPKYICTDSTVLRGTKCYGTVSTDAVLAYACPDGYAFAGEVCATDDQRDAKVKYTCSRVYTLNGDKCEKYEIVAAKAYYEESDVEESGE